MGIHQVHLQVLKFSYMEIVTVYTKKNASLEEAYNPFRRNVKHFS